LKSWLPTWSRPAAIRAARATIVMPGLFVITDKVIGNLQMALFAAFGAFATLVLVSFAGTRRDKLIAHLALAAVGSVLLIIGTAVNSSTALAAAVTLPVTFAVFFAGVAGPNAASGVTGALLVYVLPAASPGTISMIPDRLAGWWLASVVGTAAVLAFPTPATGDRLRGAAAKLALALAEELDAVLRGAATDAQLQTCIEAKHELLAQFTATPFRPTGLAVPDQALADSVELLEWCTSLVVDSVHERGDLRDAASADRELLEAAAVVLRESAGIFAGGDAPPELERLEDSRRRSVARLHRLTPGGADFRAQAQIAFHADAIAVTVLAIGADAVLAARLADADWIADARTRWFGASSLGPRVDRRLDGVSRYTRIAFRHASVRSVWFINSLRGAVALAAAVAVADLSNVQHGFWVVLGTLSVLRTNAASTGATALRALVGTAAGFAVGAALLLAIGSSSTALWIALPLAVLVAAYAPGTAPFAVGQAAFTVTVAVLFNLLVPVGWKVGELRIEDVAIGCAVSVVVGSLFWPRGVASVVGDDLADAYRSGAAYLSHAVAWACGLRTDEPNGARPAVTAGLRLDEALRGFLAEQGTKHIRKEQLWRLVGGTLRLRLTAHAVAGLPRDDTHDVGTARAEIGRRAEILEAFYERLAAQLDRPRGQADATLVAPTFHGNRAEGSTRSRPTIWLCEHLDHLSEHLDELVLPAAQLAEIRRRPWWR
jgi:uncharacterized membrane protein YccC